MRASNAHHILYILSVILLKELSVCPPGDQVLSTLVLPVLSLLFTKYSYRVNF